MIKTETFMQPIFVIKNENALGPNSYIGIDSGSGGYPYETSFKMAHWFSSYESAADYKRIFKDGFHKIYQIESFQLRQIDEDNMNNKRFEEELKALKEKYGVK